MASKAASKRLNKEYVAMQREPPPFVWAVPDEKNILTCEPSPQPARVPTMYLTPLTGNYIIVRTLNHLSCSPIENAN
ncbi:hypothetical protein QCA50_008875 [Cerrena zonata]|uniref:Uncharacterized protein n=1 Tax=Cerrena zonata TaxID=2478898 RepID=A0AAW0G2D4_9APHY